MASFNAIFLERNTLEREKNERRRGPKPVRTSILWSQTSWLEAEVGLDNGRVCFEHEGRTWSFDGALLESAKRALEKLRFRALDPDEMERLETRRRLWKMWDECASLEHLRSATLRARLVLESLLVEPLLPSPAREFCRLPARDQKELLFELQEERYLPSTRHFARWLARNRAFSCWQHEADFPVSLACRLELTGDIMPPIFCCDNELALTLPELIALAKSQTPERTRQIAQFWCGMSWSWPSLRPLYDLLKPAVVREFATKWRKLEEKWRPQWVTLWREIALHDVETGRRALQFHELMVSIDLSRWRENIYKSSAQLSLLNWFNGLNQVALERVRSLRTHPDSATLIDFLSELWLELDELFTPHFDSHVLAPSLKAARLLGIATARELREKDLLFLAHEFDKNALALQLTVDWAKRGEGTPWLYQLNHVELNERNVAFLRREAELCFSLFERCPALGAEARGVLWDDVLSYKEKYSLNPTYWRLLRAIAPLFLAKMEVWHADNIDNLGDWLALWTRLFSDFRWEIPQSLSFCERLLAFIERKFDVFNTAPSRLNSIDSPWETFARLSHHVGKTSEEIGCHCEDVLKWLAHGKEERTHNWWDVCQSVPRLAHRPRLVQAILRVSRRSPGIVRELLPQIQTLQRLHLSAELDLVEGEPPVPTGELKKLALRFPALQSAVGELYEWQRDDEASEVPAAIRELLGREAKWRREAEFLRAKLAASPNAHLQTRLENLESRLAAHTDSAQLEREVANALETATDSLIGSRLSSMITCALQERLRALCGSVADSVEWSDDWANALLIACECEWNRKWATKLLRAQSQQGSGWQRQLDANVTWLEELAAQDKNRVAFESDQCVQIGEWELWIERDTLQILQMGNRFSTCLSRGGCNSHSTIANAIDANKLVVYARRNGHIQARQLWAVTKEWRLAGFHIYANLSESARHKSGVELAFCEFAHRFASQCQLELNEDEGAEVPELCGPEWYNDGLVAWSHWKDRSERAARPTSSRRSRNE